MHDPIVVLDFETTGMNPHDGARITEVAALRVHEGRIVERLVSLVNCGVSVPPFITSLTGISTAMVRRAPPAAQVVPQLLEFIGRDAVLAHNASFDEKFLLAEAERLQLSPRHSHLLCSLKLARRLLPGLPSYALGRLAQHCQIHFSGRAHRAEADAEVTAGVLFHLTARVQQHGIPTVTTDLLAQLTRQPAARVPQWLAQRGETGAMTEV